jgi:hypothetical protein
VDGDCAENVTDDEEATRILDHECHLCSLEISVATSSGASAPPHVHGV